METKVIDDTLSLVSKEVIDKLKVQKPYKIYDSVGCNECGGRGFKGRIGIFEVLSMNKEIENIILTDMSETKIEAVMKKQGLLNLREDGIIKVLNGVTSLSEIMKETDLN
jgi:type IV pilus assembly protein PilB